MHRAEHLQYLCSSGLHGLDMKPTKSNPVPNLPKTIWLNPRCTAIPEIVAPGERASRRLDEVPEWRSLAPEQKESWLKDFQLVVFNFEPSKRKPPGT